MPDFLTAPIIAAVIVTLSHTALINQKENTRILKVTVPENLEFEGMFDSVLKKYSNKYTLLKVKTTNMGSVSVRTRQLLNSTRTEWYAQLWENVILINNNYNRLQRKQICYSRNKSFDFHGKHVFTVQ